MYEQTQVLTKKKKKKNKPEIAEKIVNLVKLHFWENMKNMGKYEKIPEFDE